MFWKFNYCKILGGDRNERSMQVVWGTDSPFVDYEGEFKKMERATDSKEAYELIVGGNIARILGIE